MNKGEETRSLIIEKSAELFNTLGYNGCSLNEIMEATQLKKGGIYNHFKNLPVSNFYCNRGLWLPSSLDIKNKDIDKICALINKNITNIIKADFGIYRNNNWKLYGVKNFDVDTLEIRILENLDWVTTIPPERFISLAIVADQVNLPRLRRTIEQLKLEGHSTDTLDTMMYQKFVSPLSTILMPLLAGLAAFGLHRSGNLLIRILITLLIGFSFFVINNLFIALGQYGAVPPIIAAWLPLLLFGLAGISFILQTEE